MGKVGEELHFRLRLFQYFLFLHTLQLQAILNAEEVDGPDHQYQTEQDVERLCPRSIVPGRNDMNLQCISPVRWFSISVDVYKRQVYSLITIVSACFLSMSTITMQYFPWLRLTEKSGYLLPTVSGWQTSRRWKSVG